MHELISGWNYIGWDGTKVLMNDRETMGATLPVIDAARTCGALAFPQLIEALRHAFASGADVPERHHHAIRQPGRNDATLLLMPAWQARSIGVKIVTIFPGNGAKGLSALHSSYLLSDGETGVPIALLDGNEITTRRTVAMSALAADYLAIPEAASLLIVGAGRIARLTAAAYAAVRPIRRVAVWNRDPAKAVVLAEQLQDEGFEARAAPSLADAAIQADIVSCATLSTEPLIRSSWLRPGAHLDLIGGFTPTMREAEDACFARGLVHVDTPHAIGETGDLIDPIRHGVLRVEDVRGTLADLCAARVAGRPEDADLTIFKSVGTALADLAAAALVRDSLGL